MANFDVTRSIQNKKELTNLNSLQYNNNCLAIHKSTQVNFNNPGEFSDRRWDTKNINLIDIHQRILKSEVNSIHEAIAILKIMIDSIKCIKEILFEMRLKVLEAVSENPGTDQSEFIYDLLKHYLSQIDVISDDTQISVRKKIRRIDTPFLIETLTNSTGSELNNYFCTYPFDAKFLSLENLIISFANGNFEHVSDAIVVIDAAINTTDSVSSSITELRSHLIFKQETRTTPYNDVGVNDDRIMNDEMAQEQLQLSKSMILNHTSIAVLVHTNMAPLLFRTFKN